MCGIYGIIGYQPKILTKIMKASKYRGPDNNGTYCDENISIGHNLLAITDDANISKQPWTIKTNKNTHVLSYNGEIYNYLDLKIELENQGCIFQTESDTEILATGLKLYGKEFLYKLDGMFAIAWYDKNKNTLSLARDQSGVKPLYYTTRNKIAFSSSVDSLMACDIDTQLDKFAFSLYSYFGFVPGPKTCFKYVQKLYPGQVLVFDLKSKRIIEDLHLHKQLIDVEYHPEELQDYISKTTKKCLMGKRKIGLFLSGGLDSSIILHEASKYHKNINTFTTSFKYNDKHNKRYNDDALTAKKLTNLYNTKHHELNISLDDFINNLEKTTKIFSEPITKME